MAELLTFGNVIAVENNTNSDIIQFPTHRGNGLGIQKEYRWVDPITDKKDVARIIKYLRKRVEDTRGRKRDIYHAKIRDLLLFQIGINVGLRVSDLLNLTWGHFLANDMETFLTINNKKEQKTKKLKSIIPNKMIKDAIKEYLDNCYEIPKPTDYMFCNSKGRKITDACVENFVKTIAKELKLDGNYNTHSLRKTYAYHLYMNLYEHGNPLALEIVQRNLNHSSQFVTLSYLGIEKSNRIEQSENLGLYWDI